ncbi:MAG TPA: metallophosphoesterase [Nevskiaceae bacterium]
MESRLLIVTGLAWLYVCGRFVWLLPGGAAPKIVAALALLAVAEYQQVTVRWFGTLASPELPHLLLVFLGWAFGSFVLLTALLLLRDIVGALTWLVARRGGHFLLRSGALAIVVGVAAAAFGAIGTWQAIRVPAVRPVTVRVTGLPPAFDGYRIAQLSDLHASRLLPRAWMQGVVERTNALHADLIVITGDLADGTPTARAPDVAPLVRLHAPDGVLAIPGNHEYYADYEGWMAAYRHMGLPMLVNAHVLIRREDQNLAVAGVTDHQAIAFHEPAPDLAQALAGIPEGVPTILLAHRPGEASRAAAAGAALQLSGHTHGGQIPGLRWLARRSNGGFVSGLYRVAGMPLYVSNGTGLWNGLVLRLGSPAEITLLTLKPAQRSAR